MAQTLDLPPSCLVQLNRTRLASLSSACTCQPNGSKPTRRASSMRKKDTMLSADHATSAILTGIFLQCNFQGSQSFWIWLKDTKDQSAKHPPFVSHKDINIYILLLTPLIRSSIFQPEFLCLFGFLLTSSFSPVASTTRADPPSPSASLRPPQSSRSACPASRRASRPAPPACRPTPSAHQ